MVDKLCPGCGQDRLCSIEEAKAIFRTGQWGGISQMLDDADYTCEYCKVVRVDGTWMRMQTVDSRASELKQATSGKKTKSDYRDILTAGEKGDDIAEM